MQRFYFNNYQNVSLNIQNKENDGTYVELYKNKKDEIVAKTRDFEQLEYSLARGGSFRGE